MFEYVLQTFGVTRELNFSWFMVNPVKGGKNWMYLLLLSLWYIFRAKYGFSMSVVYVLRVYLSSHQCPGRGHLLSPISSFNSLTFFWKSCKEGFVNGVCQSLFSQGVIDVIQKTAKRYRTVFIFFVIDRTLDIDGGKFVCFCPDLDIFWFPSLVILWLKSFHQEGNHGYASTQTQGSLPLS